MGSFQLRTYQHLVALCVGFGLHTSIDNWLWPLVSYSWQELEEHPHLWWCAAHPLHLFPPLFRHQRRLLLPPGNAVMTWALDPLGRTSLLTWNLLPLCGNGPRVCQCMRKRSNSRRCFCCMHLMSRFWVCSFVALCTSHHSPTTLQQNRWRDGLQSSILTIRCPQPSTRVTQWSLSMSFTAKSRYCFALLWCNQYTDSLNLRHPDQYVSHSRHDNGTSNLKRHVERYVSVHSAEASSQLTMQLFASGSTYSEP